MTPKTGQQVIAIHISLDISKSNGNQAMKLDHLLEYNMKNIFIEKLYTECGREFIPRPHFLKIKIAHVYGSTV